MRIKEIITESAQISAHRTGSTIWIDYFEVPTKRAGIGTAAYFKWEKSLPSDITRIKLVAADAGYGNTADFWDSVGFSFTNDDDETDFEMEKIIG